MPVVIDNESGKIVGEFDKPKKKRKAVAKVKMPRKPRREIAPQAMDDLAVTLGAVQAIFDTADHVARILGGKR